MLGSGWRLVLRSYVRRRIAGEGARKFAWREGADQGILDRCRKLEASGLE